MLAASSGKRHVIVWGLSVCPIGTLTVTHHREACDAASVHFGLIKKSNNILVNTQIQTTQHSKAVKTSASNMFYFEFSPCHNTRGHKYKLFKHQTTACVRSNFFWERVVNVWNSLPDDVSFDSFYRFRSSIMRINLSSHLRYCGTGRLGWFAFSFIYFTLAINTVKVI